MTTIPDYERGLADGQLRSRLDDHGKRLDAINGTIAETGKQLAALTTAVALLVTAGNDAQAGRQLRFKRWQVAVAALAVIAPGALTLTLALLGLH